MSEDSWELIDVVLGDLQAEILGGFLEAQGITVLLSREGAGRAYGLNLGPLGEVQILVPASSAEEAHEIIAAYYAGDFEDLAEPEENTIDENLPPDL